MIQVDGDDVVYGVDGDNLVQLVEQGIIVVYEYLVGEEQYVQLDKVYQEQGVGVDVFLVYGRYLLVFVWV